MRHFILLFLINCSLLLAGCQVPLRTPPPYTPRAPTSTPFTPLPPTPTATATIPPSPTSACPETKGRIESGVVDNGLPDKPMRYKVYLPACYRYQMDLRYPVLYLLHGQNFTEEQWIKIGAPAAADELIASGEAQPFIIVFPFDYSYKQPDEYNFEDVFIHSLLPRIDSIYRTIPAANRRAIGGLSRGGAWALRLGTMYPDLFGAIGGHSPAIFYSDEHPLKRRLLRIEKDQLPAIWLDAGDNDSEYDLIAPFAQYLTDNNIPHEWHQYHGWHDEKYWSAHVRDYLRWYAQNWK